LGLREAKDTALWNRALQDQWIIVTKDEDFAARATHAETSPQIVWLRIGNCTNRVLFAWLDSLLPGILEGLAAGNRLVEVQHAKQ
jgi:predicted nuclease of predicted toxin-antitoxin system